MLAHDGAPGQCGLRGDGKIPGQSTSHFGFRGRAFPARRPHPSTTGPLSRAAAPRHPGTAGLPPAGPRGTPPCFPGTRPPALRSRTLGHKARVYGAVCLRRRARAARCISASARCRRPAARPWRTCSSTAVNTRTGGPDLGGHGHRQDPPPLRGAGRRGRATVVASCTERRTGTAGAARRRSRAGRGRGLGGGRRGRHGRPVDQHPAGPRPAARLHTRPGGQPGLGRLPGRW